MSGFVPHFIAGVAAGTVSTGILGIHQYPEFSLLTALPFVTGIGGALTPDMDIKSTSSAVMYLFYLGVACYLFFNGWPVYGFLLLIYSLLPQFFKHRGFIHSLVFGVISACGLFGLCYYNSLATCISVATSLSYLFGFITHVLLDED